MTSPILTIETLTPVTVARGLRDTMDLAYLGEITDETATIAMTQLFDDCLPHYQSIFDADPWAAEQVANAAEWLDRLDDLPEII